MKVLDLLLFLFVCIIRGLSWGKIVRALWWIDYMGEKLEVSRPNRGCENMRVNIHTYCSTVKDNKTSPFPGSYNHSDFYSNFEGEVLLIIPYLQAVFPQRNKNPQIQYSFSSQLPFFLIFVEWINRSLFNLHIYLENSHHVRENIDVMRGFFFFSISLLLLSLLSSLSSSWWSWNPNSS